MAKKSENVWLDATGSAIADGIKTAVFDAAPDLKARILQGGLEAAKTYFIEVTVKLGIRFITQILTEEEFREKVARGIANAAIGTLAVGGVVLAAPVVLTALGIVYLGKALGLAEEIPEDEQRPYDWSDPTNTMAW